MKLEKAPSPLPVLCCVSEFTFFDQVVVVVVKFEKAPYFKSRFSDNKIVFAYMMHLFMIC